MRDPWDQPYCEWCERTYRRHIRVGGLDEKELHEHLRKVHGWDIADDD